MQEHEGTQDDTQHLKLWTARHRQMVQVLEGVDADDTAEDVVESQVVRKERKSDAAHENEDPQERFVVIIQSIGGIENRVPVDDDRVDKVEETEDENGLLDAELQHEEGDEVAHDERVESLQPFVINVERQPFGLRVVDGYFGAQQVGVAQSQQRNGNAKPSHHDVITEVGHEMCGAQ